MSKIQIDVVGNFDDTIKKMSEIERKGLDLNVRSDIVKQFTQATDVLKERTTNALTAAGEAGFGAKFMKKIVKIEDKFKGMMADAHQDATKVGQQMVTNAEKVAKLNKEIGNEKIRRYQK